MQVSAAASSAIQGLDVSGQKDRAAKPTEPVRPETVQPEPPQAPKAATGPGVGTRLDLAA